MFEKISGTKNIKQAEAAFDSVFNTMVQAVKNQDSHLAQIIANCVDMAVVTFEAGLSTRKNPTLYNAVEAQDKAVLTNTINDYFLAFTDNKTLAKNIVVVAAAFAELNVNFQNISN